MLINIKRRVLILAVGAATLATVAGCGGDSAEDQASGDDQTVTAPIAKAEFVRKATAICEGLTERLLEETEEREGEEQGGSKAEAVRTRLVPIVENEIDELRALGAPKGDEKQLDAIYASMEEVMQSAESDPQRFIYELINFKRPYSKVEKLATAYGIPNCAQP